MTGFLRLARQRALWAWYLIGSAVLTFLYVAVPPFKGSAPLINLIGLSSPAAIALGMRIHRPKAMIAWGLMCAGQLLYVAGDVYTYSYPAVFGGHVGFPSTGDAMYLSVYPLLVGGLLLLVRRRNPRPDREAVIDSLILTVGFALLSWVFLVAPNLHLSGLDPLAKIVSVAYPIGDVLLLAAVIRLAVDAGRRAASFFLLVSSIVALLATDCAYNYALLVGSYNHQLIYDIGWIAYLVLWGAAALHPSMLTLEQPALDNRTRLTAKRLVLLAAACLIAPMIRFADEIHNPDILVIIVASAVLFLLVVARMAGLVRREERAVAQELALRRAGVQLVGADPLRVNDAVISATRELVGPDAHIRLALCSFDEVTLAASSDGDASATPFPPDAAGWLHATTVSRVSLPLSTVPYSVREAMQLRHGETVLLVPVQLRDDSRGALVIETVGALSAEELDGLDALVSQVSLALERAALTEDLHREKSEARFRSLVAHASDMITVLDENGTVTYQSPSIERILGLSPEAIEGTPFELLLAEADRPRLARMLDGQSETAPESHATEYSLQHSDGRWLQFEVRHTDLLHDEHVAGVVLNSRDVSERKLFEDQLAHQAFHDPVTGLANRALFSDRVKHSLRSTIRKGSLIGVMFIDLDDFKTVNDSLGHPAGDRVLDQVARRLESAVRPSDTVARFGGDEFAVLLDGVGSSDEAATIAERVLRALDAPVALEGKEVYARASVGICMSSEDLRQQDAEELLRNADVAMYMAKRDSKGSYRLFEPAMHERVVERLELRAELQRALELGQLEVYYQPVVQLDGEQDYGVEALLRWIHPKRGVIAPLQFIPLAEETGLIVPIGRWVLLEACRQGAALHHHFPRRPPLTISVNLSVRQLQSESIVADVRDALQLTKIEPSSLVLEITETVMMADPDTATARLRELKNLGVRIAMDDFGTGYSSLSYLSRLPVDILKMDRSFLADGSDPDSGLAAAIIAIGERLGLDVVAEGIEHNEQLPALRKLGCELGQGFLFARPMPHHELVGYLTAEESSEAFDSASNANA